MELTTCCCQAAQVSGGPSTTRGAAHFNRNCPHSTLFLTTRPWGDSAAFYPERSKNFAAAAAGRRARRLTARKVSPKRPVLAPDDVEAARAQVRAELSKKAMPKRHGARTIMTEDTASGASDDQAPDTRHDLGELAA